MNDLLYGCDICQDVCPWNVRFARELPQGSPFEARAAVRAKTAAQLARELESMDAAQFTAAFKGSPMKRAKLAGLKRNSAVVLENAASEDMGAD
jgi:epoxyqueuosine reductase